MVTGPRVYQLKLDFDMKIALIGYGKMGRAIEKIATDRGHSIILKVDAENLQEINEVKPDKCDVAIEFTSPDVAYDNIIKILSQDVPLVTGTTGWLDRLDEVKSLCKERQGAFFYASNFSIGANIFFQMSEQLARLMNKTDYTVSMKETHHTEKKDSPSGTAITLAEGIISNIDRLEGWKEGTVNNPSELSISAFREPGVPGTHEINYNSEQDEIKIKHTAHSRDGFALGAVMAAEWLQGKKGTFTMKDMLV